MIISERQIMKMLYLMTCYAELLCSTGLKGEAEMVLNFVAEIQNQQSDELKVVE